MNSILVAAHGVSKDYPIPGGGAVSVLQGIDCSIRANDRIALLGPSGSGKSTLMHILGGLIEPTRGTVSWPGLGARADLQPSKVQFVFQSPSLFPALTVARNVALPMILAGGFADAHVRANTMLERFGLADLARKLPEELSGGQAQRVSMARALAISPKLILADEPTGQLDSRTASEFLDTVLELVTGSGAALVIATHDLGIADRMDRRLILAHGNLSIPREHLELNS